MYSIVQSIPNHLLLDIVGDVHGEYDDLQALLKYLGYGPLGEHKQDRKLVFVGDLCDRGPNSPAVIEWVRNAMQAQNAYAVLGNHEFNILANDCKDGNAWFFAQQEVDDIPRYGRQVSYIRDMASKTKIVEFLKTLPVALYRDDLRIIHAAWQACAISQIRAQKFSDAQQAYVYYENKIANDLNLQSWYPQYQVEQPAYAKVKKNEHSQPSYFQAIADYDLYASNYSLIRQLVSGPETQTPHSFFAGGRWRYVERQQWWNDYTDDIAVVIGHYWRKWSETADLTVDDLFKGIPRNAWFGKKNNVFCVDYSIGGKWRLRQPNSVANPDSFRLAALQWPEKTLTFADGEVVATVSG